MPSNSAAYMREYRKKRKAAHATYDDGKALIGQLKTRIDELEEEVARLKRELAARPVRGTAVISGPAIDRSSFHEFRPVPKPGRK